MARDLALVERLERLGYRRVHERPDQAGEFFYGNEVIWIYRRATHARGEDRPAELFGLELDAGTGKVLGRRDADGADAADPRRRRRLDRARAARRVAARRARRSRPGRGSTTSPSASGEPSSPPRTRASSSIRESIRSALRAPPSTTSASGALAQGGSTITQQLVKNRDLTPKRTLGRKANEAVRALALEAEYSKNEILESYLEHRLLRQRRGLAVHGIGAAARVYFSKPAQSLTLEEAARWRR